MKVVLFSDLHLDSAYSWAPPRVGRARRMALRETLTRICRLAVDVGADALCCGGDLYEQDRFTPDTAEFLRCTFAELAPMPVIIAPGNHDWLGPASLYRRVRWTPNVHIFDQDHLVPFDLAEGLTLWGAAHLAPAGTRGFLDDFRVDRGGVNIALFHGSEQGEFPSQGDGKIAHAPFRAAQISSAGLDHALLGHYHAPSDAGEYTYPGNPDPLTFGETGDRGAVLVEIAGDGSLTRKWHNVAVSAVGDVTVDLSGITHSGQARDRVRQALGGRTGSVRVTLEGEIGADVDLRIQELESLAVPPLDVVVVRAGSVFPAYDLEQLQSEATVRGQFVRDVLGSGELEEDQRHAVLVTGLRALEGRGDELEVLS